MSDRAEAILAQMTLQEKIDMLAGADFWTTVPNSRLDIPALKVSDGPNGARGGDFGMGPTAACLPVGIAIGATWDPDLVEEIGGVLADEAKSKGANILLAPTINVHRSLLNGRNFECFSEDPWLSSRITVAYINGLQENGIGACPKHFVANDSEFERYTMNSIVDERALREIYLPAFKAAVQEADAWAIMSGYNKINGLWASENPRLLKEVLKNEWGFEGIVMSDWFGTYSPAIGNGGLDLEMPGPSRWAKSLLEEVNAGRLAETEVDDKIRRLLYTLERSGQFDDPVIPEERAENRPEHHEILRRAAAESIVLLKNEGDLLPLTPEKAPTVALIGGNARWPGVMGGGSAIVPAHYVVTPLEGLTARFGEAHEMQYIIGATSQKMVPLFDLDRIQTPTGEPGVSIQYFDGKELAGDPVAVETVTRLSITMMGQVHEALTDESDYSLRIEGYFTPEATGTHTFSMITQGLGRMFVNGTEIIDNWDDFYAGISLFDIDQGEKRAQVDLIAGEAAHVVVETNSANTFLVNTIRIGVMPPMPEDPIAVAAEAARAADVAVVFVGTSQEWETEGGDQETVELPGEQNALVSAVAATNPNTIVVVNTGTPKLLPWIDEVPAVLQSWFLGQEGGNAIADVLSGDVNPSGRLPQTFPKRAEDNPAHLNYPGENDNVLYGESIFVGYRFYQKRNIEPRFPFGHGLSYSSFEYSNLRLSKTAIEAGDSVTVSVDVTNTGSQAGKEVVQLYVHDVVSRLVRPEQELKAFQKVMLAPGETKTVELTLNEASFSYYDPAQGGWLAESGTFEIRVGRSSSDIRLTTALELDNPLDRPEIVKEGELHVGMPIGMLLQHPVSQPVMGQMLPDLSRAPTMIFNAAKPLEQFAIENPHLIPPRLLGTINQSLLAAAKNVG